jgi:serine/threonine protein kinase
MRSFIVIACIAFLGGVHIMLIASQTSKIVPPPQVKTQRIAKLERRINSFESKRLSIQQDDGTKLTPTTLPSPTFTTRQLTFDDLQIGEFIGNGAINLVARVELPNWWYQQQSVDDNTIKYVVKLAAGGWWRTSQGNRECDIFETLSKNQTMAKRHNIIPAIWLARNFSNPFHTNTSKIIPSSFPEKYQERLRKEPELVAIVVPYMKLHKPHSWVEDLNDIRLFIQSLLQVLEYSHSLGINNFDLSESNVKIDKHGRAVVMDWNANKIQGQEIYDETANTWITAPEGLLEHGDDSADEMLQTSISAMDVWSVGVMLANLVYEPCYWVNPRGVGAHHSQIQQDITKFPKHYKLIRAMLLDIGGETRIPIGDGKMLDLAPLVGLNRTEILNRTFDLPLYSSNAKCELKEFAMLKEATQRDMKNILSFLETAMKISPADRPEASTLLQHSFFTGTDSIDNDALDEEESMDESSPDLAEVLASVPKQYLVDPSNNNNNTDAQPSSISFDRELTFDDLKLGKFVGHGAINIVSQVYLPEWWYRQHNINRRRKYVIKMAAGNSWYTDQGDRECDIFEALASNRTLAMEHNIIPAVFLLRTVPNPFRNVSKHIPESFPEKYAKRLRRAKNLVAIVAPYLDLDYIQYVNSFQGIRILIKSLLRILEYSHSLGINNFDLGDSNVRIDDDGKAVVMDWNANKKQGQDIFDASANLWLTAPEGMLEHGPDGETIRQTSISAMDIWSVGIMLVSLAYKPCGWVDPMVRARRKSYPRNYNLLRETILAVGGETRIPIGPDQTLDLAPLLGVNRSQVLKKEFEMPLFMNEQKCDTNNTAFPRLKGGTEQDLEYVHSFLQSMMKISPAERPDASTLLQHPFMDF